MQARAARLAVDTGAFDRVHCVNGGPTAGLFQSERTDGQRAGEGAGGDHEGAAQEDRLYFPETYSIFIHKRNAAVSGQGGAGGARGVRQQ